MIGGVIGLHVVDDPTDNFRGTLRPGLQRMRFWLLGEPRVKDSPNAWNPKAITILKALNMAKPFLRLRDSSHVGAESWRTATVLPTSHPSSPPKPPAS